MTKRITRVAPGASSPDVRLTSCRVFLSLSGQHAADTRTRQRVFWRATSLTLLESPSRDDLGVTPPFVENCTLSREPEVTTAPELLWRGLRGSLDQIENLSSASPVDLDITPILLVISGHDTPNSVGKKAPNNLETHTFLVSFCELFCVRACQILDLEYLTQLMGLRTRTVRRACSQEPQLRKRKNAYAEAPKRSGVDFKGSVIWVSHWVSHQILTADPYFLRWTFGFGVF